MDNYTRPCYVLKMDISGYFMHIDRCRLLDITLRRLRRMASHPTGTRATPPATVAGGDARAPLSAGGVARAPLSAGGDARAPVRWRDVVDMEFVAWLSRVIITSAT